MSFSTNCCPLAFPEGRWPPQQAVKHAKRLICLFRDKTDQLMPRCFEWMSAIIGNSLFLSMRAFFDLKTLNVFIAVRVCVTMTTTKWSVSTPLLSMVYSVMFFVWSSLVQLSIHKKFVLK